MTDEKKDYLITKFNTDGTTVTDNSSRNYTGKAQVVYPTGDLYEGDFLEGQRSGHGIYTYIEKGEKYEGEWLKNLKHGIGKATYTEGEFFGRFENGKRHGEGVFTYKKSRDIYSGSWKHGKKHGNGTYIFTDTKTKIVGKWENGEIVEGKWVFPNGTYFEGKFTKNKPNGVGVWHFANGNVVKGEFSQQMIEDVNTGDNVIQTNWNTHNEIVDPTRIRDSF